jgi:hypothetical protein
VRDLAEPRRESESGQPNPAAGLKWMDPGWTHPCAQPSAARQEVLADKVVGRPLRHPIGPPHVKLAEVIAAMVVTTARYEDVTDAVCSQIPHQRAAARERGESGRG